MNFHLIKADSVQQKSWSGGTTTELFIYPPAANYAQRNFDFRLSTATVEMEKSEFTRLPGYARKLMVLAGETTLHHQHQHTKTLQKFAVDAFEGNWKTTAAGTCTDFNVMTRQPFTSFLSAQIVAQNEVASFQPKATAAWFFIYRFSGTADLVMPNQSQLKRGDMLMLQNPGIRQIKIRARETCELIITEIWQLPYIG